MLQPQAHIEKTVTGGTTSPKTSKLYPQQTYPKHLKPNDSPAISEPSSLYDRSPKQPNKPFEPLKLPKSLDRRTNSPKNLQILRRGGCKEIQQTPTCKTNGREPLDSHTSISFSLSFYLSICLPVCLSVYPSICLSVCLSIYLAVGLSVCLPIFFY